MMSAEDIALTKIAIHLCHKPELKREILWAPGSTYDIEFRKVRQRKVWYDILEKNATPLIRSLGLSKHLQGKVLEVLLLIAIRMLNWAVYHEDILGLSREQSINALNSSLFTQQGLVDNKKAALELMKDEDLSKNQQYKLACLYCFTDLISSLHSEMTKEEKEEFYDTQRVQRSKHPELVTFWSCCLKGGIAKLRGNKPNFQYMLEIAVKSGSKAGVEWCLETASSGLNDNSILDAAIETVRNVKLSSNDSVFIAYRYNTNSSWIPHYYFIDVLCFLLSKMRCSQQIDFFKKDIEVFHSSSVLKYFLDWPYQNYFLKAANSMWEFLPEKSYFDLMQQISYHLSNGKKSYDYSKVFRKFWCNSPDHYKRYLFCNKDVTFNRIGNIFISLILSSETDNLTNEYWQNILLILADARNEEKEHIIYSDEGTVVCMKILKAECWKMLDEFILYCIPSKEQADMFKRDLSIKEKVVGIFLDFVKTDNWNAVESFIEWSSLNEVGINELKKIAIYSKQGREACTYIISHKNNIKPAEKFIRWFISLEENVKAYKKELAFSHEGMNLCACLIKKDKLELVNEFVNWILSSEGDITEFKKNVAYTEGPAVCKYLLSNIVLQQHYDEDADILNRSVLKFEGCNWEQVEVFLTWAFSCERDIIEFKRGVLLEKEGTNIIFSLVRLNQWEATEVFFAWIGLTTEQINQLKKETIFNHCQSFDMFVTMVYTKYWNYDEDYGSTFQDYGNKQEAIELFLRWFLTDKEMAIEFMNEFIDLDNAAINERTQHININEKIVALYYFLLALQQRLCDLNLEQRGTKRKFTAEL